MSAYGHVQAKLTEGIPIPDDAEGILAKKIVSGLQAGRSVHAIARELAINEGIVVQIQRLLNGGMPSARPRVAEGVRGTGQSVVPVSSSESVLV